MHTVPINLTLENIWRSWWRFRRGKRRTQELDTWQYYLEDNLFRLNTDLNNGVYRHGSYRRFTVSDTKRRDIAVASVRDRVVHRLIYDYLVGIFDKTFIYDAWSCRKGKGLLGAIVRSQESLHSFPHGYVWRADITKFFDHVQHVTLRYCLRRKISDLKTLGLLDGIIASYSFGSHYERERALAPRIGLPIGNLTSQIFANIYFNEFDRFIVHTLKPHRYLRYGDDFILLDSRREKVSVMKQQSIAFLQTKLGLAINRKNDIIVPVKSGIHFLGVEIFPSGRRLKQQNWERLRRRLAHHNIPSYYGLVNKHAGKKQIKYFDWLIIKHYEKFF